MSDANPDFVTWLKGVPARLRDDGYRQGLTDGSSVAEEIMRECERRGAALAVEQVRRMAEEMARGSAPGNLGKAIAVLCHEGEGLVVQDCHAAADIGWTYALRELARSLPSPDLAAEVRRIEERGAEAYRDRLYDLATKIAENPHVYFAVALSNDRAEYISLGIHELLRRLEGGAE